MIHTHTNRTCKLGPKPCEGAHNDKYILKKRCCSTASIENLKTKNQQRNKTQKQMHENGWTPAKASPGDFTQTSEIHAFFTRFMKGFTQISRVWFGHFLVSGILSKHPSQL
jgi:hypothetical protein